eukprot:CAMPEP_0172931030 /NCGR_PEP_ID=MMETSP1075-20121228/219289_1 /TAXON_ID=2916 /ORGANISM="Ceratium fusus, Strain PA161109" /LENGTH=156 /DNA_ID=CAMNT_0013792343 /DNA_START=164 /DNA_END=633 /DNA_ORIENTATION=-
MVQDMMKSNIHPMAAASSDDENKDMASTNDQDDSSVVSPARWSRGRRGGRRIQQKREAAARACKMGNSTMNVDVKEMLVLFDHPFQTCPFGNDIMKLPEFGSASMDADFMKVAPMPGEIPATKLAVSDEWPLFASMDADFMKVAPMPGEIPATKLA